MILKMPKRNPYYRWNEMNSLPTQGGMQKKKNASKEMLEKLVTAVNVCSFVLSFFTCCHHYLVWGYSPSGKGAFCDPVELPLLRLLLSLLTDKLDLSFLCILCDTGVDGCFLGCSVVGAVAATLVPGTDPPMTPMLLMLAPQEHTRVAPAPPMPGWIPLPLLSAGVPELFWRKPFWSLAAPPSAGSKSTGWDSDWGWAGGKHEKERISVLLLFSKKLCVWIQYNYLN